MSQEEKNKVRSTRCYICTNDDIVTEFLYKDVNRIKRYLNERAMITPRVKTRLCAYHQRKLTKAVKKARFLALLPVGGRASL